ncbi:hypothetical protein A5844_002082 [Enterococcus sp. 10A9_DIV0425]|uniref:Uncharacterized protein n=1 Tax=Candidatus Enterococcus wittei TaxID=1987383 RepID=A0A242JYS6_9ENTE|nr:hypothetical protein A5844_002082 [Enterococcus sp. 10A9_DIV0425]
MKQKSINTLLIRKVTFKKINRNYFLKSFFYQFFGKKEGKFWGEIKNYWM